MMYCMGKTMTYFSRMGRGANAGIKQMPSDVQGPSGSDIGFVTFASWHTALIHGPLVDVGRLNDDVLHGLTIVKLSSNAILLYHKMYNHAAWTFSWS